MQTNQINEAHVCHKKQVMNRERALTTKHNAQRDIIQITLFETPKNN